MDWSSRRFRGKAKTKTEMKKLLKRIEEHYQREEEVFRAGGRDEEEEEKFEFLISSDEPTLPKRPVHMPGYPE